MTDTHEVIVNTYLYLKSLPLCSSGRLFNIQPTDNITLQFLSLPFSWQQASWQEL